MNNRWGISSECLVVVLLTTLLTVSCSSHETTDTSSNNLSDKVVSAFITPTNQVTLYSIEPDEVGKENFHGYKVLGKAPLSNDESTRILTDLQTSLVNPEHGFANCFEPHHALRVQANGDIYDLIICYLCGELNVYKMDSTPTGNEIAALSLTGSPDLIDSIATAHGLPTPKILIQNKQQLKKSQNEKEGWLRVMPKSIKPLWNKEMWGYSPFGGQDKFEPMAEAIKREYPDEEQQILVLFAWRGTGADPSSGVPSYELVPAELLQNYPHSDLLAVAQSDQLTQPQLEGAVRFFSGNYIRAEDSRNRRTLIAALHRYQKETDHWISAMPSSIRPLWKDQFWYHGCGSGHKLTDEETNSMLDALRGEFSDKKQQILALFSWYGADYGTKRNTCDYEIIAQDLLYRFTTSELGEALQSTKLNKYQLDGAVRLFADFFYQRDRPHEVSGLPAPLKEILLDHIKKSGNKFWNEYALEFK